MATKLRRIALSADPKLEAAIAAARRELGDMAESRLVRELALRGSRDLEPDPIALTKARFEADGVEWPVRSLGDLLGRMPALGPPDPEDPYPGTRALEEVREDRV
jgi:hypothetical protein